MMEHKEFPPYKVIYEIEGRAEKLFEKVFKTAMKQVAKDLGEYANKSKSDTGTN